MARLNPWDIMPIDKEATREAVEDRLQRIAFYRRFGSVRREAALTPSYELKEGGSSGAISKQTENIAVFNVHEDQMNEHYSQLLDKTLARMRSREKDIIQACYLELDPDYDFNIAKEMGMSISSFNMHKSKAIYNLAMGMRLEVME
jgi:ArpU family phage transcriptional regulator